MPNPPFDYILPEDRFRFLLKLEINRAFRDEHYFSVFIVKLRGADSHSHLLEVVHTFHPAIRETDDRGALGQFRAATILRKADYENLDAIVSRIAPLIQSHPQCAEPTPCRYRISLGGATFPTDGTTPEDLLNAAEENCREI